MLPQYPLCATFTISSTTEDISLSDQVYFLEIKLGYSLSMEPSQNGCESLVPLTKPTNLDEAIKELLASYQELNGRIDELDEEPSPLDFMRYVSKNRPFVSRGGCSTWPAVRKWDFNYLRNKLNKTLVKVAITTKGLVHFGDSPNCTKVRTERVAK